MKSTKSVPGEILLLAIGYKYKYRKFLGLIATEVDGSNEPSDTYLSNFPDIYSNVSVQPVACPHFLVRHFNACKAIDIHNMIRQCSSAIEILGNTEWLF